MKSPLTVARNIAKAGGYGRLIVFWGCFALPAFAQAQMPLIHVDASHFENPITPWLTGSCIEDVNHEIYGGLYDQKLFGESFEEPPLSARFAGWTACGGSWQPEGNGCTVDAQPGAKLVRGDPLFSDGTVEADIRIPIGSIGNAGLLVRVAHAGVGADNFNGYEVSLTADGRQIVLGKHQHDFHLLAAAPVTATPGHWHRLKVVLTGPHISVFLDSTASPALVCTDRDPLPAGTFALRNWLTPASFRSISVHTAGLSNDIPLQAGPAPSVSGMWDPIATGTAKAGFLHDASDPFNGDYCQRITDRGGQGRVGIANRGLNRWGIAVQKGQRFAGRIYLRARKLQGAVTVALQSVDGSQTYAVQTIHPVAASWTKCPFTLKSSATDPDARFAIWIDHPGTLWVDQAVLMGTGSERFHGLPVRADIADALIAQGVTFLRYGGTMVNAPGYRWKNMIGDRDKRPPYDGTWYPYSSNGFGIFDFLNFCEKAHIAAAFAINIEETAQDCADLADYLTAPVTNPWGRKRAADGHPAPYSVQYIEIGNEESLGADDPAAYRHYAQRFQIIARAIHSRNPHIKLVCAAWWRPDSPNMKTVFDAIDGQAAAWDLHVGADGLQSGRSVSQTLSTMQQRFRQWDPKTSVQAVIFEENGGLHNMQRALGHATVLNAARRHGDFLVADCAANCLQPWQQNDNGWDQGQIFFTPSHVWAMPPYYAQQMASETYEPIRVQSTVTDSTDLSVTATRSTDGKTLVLSVVNTSDASEQTEVSLSGFPDHTPTIATWTLSGPLSAVNPPVGPEPYHTVQRQVDVSGPLFAYLFPAHSDTILRLTR